MLEMNNLVPRVLSLSRGRERTLGTRLGNENRDCNYWLRDDVIKNSVLI